MQPGVVAVESGAKVSGVARLMAEKSIRNIFVMTKGEPAGVVRDWDIVTRVVALNLDPETVNVNEIMHTPVASVKADAELVEIANVMAESGVRRVLVMDEGKVLGTITAEALLSHYGVGASLTVPENLSA
jgi:CBS domain-containing protein